MIISLIQLSTFNCDFIIDCFYLRDALRSSPTAGLPVLFSNPGITKILHGCDSDIKYLVADLGIITVNLFDTARAFSFLQRIPKVEDILASKLQMGKHINYISLEKLAKLILDIDLDKLFQVADWRIRPLPTGMLDYARSDSHYLIPLYQYMLALLCSDGQAISIPPRLLEFAAKSQNVSFLENIAAIRGSPEQRELVAKLLNQLELTTKQFSIARMFSKNNHKRLEIKIKK